MGRLVRTQRVGNGATIIGNGRTIDVVITAIGEAYIDSVIDSVLSSESRQYSNNGHYKIAVVHVAGVEDIDPKKPNVLLSMVNSLELGDGVKIGVTRSPTSKNSIAMMYGAPEEYVINRKE